MIIKDANHDHLLQFETIANRIVEKQNLSRDSTEEFTVYTTPPRTGRGNISHSKGRMSASPIAD